MFTGIVTHTAMLAERAEEGADIRLGIDAGAGFLDGCKVGDSISVAGVCLTVTGLDADKGLFRVDVSAETLARTTLGRAQPGDRVNLERAMRLGDRLDGHLVSGHVDGLVVLRECQPDGRSRRLDLEAPTALMRYIAPKGSVCLDGVSLTVNEVRDSLFSVCVIPHTLEVTTLGERSPGDRLNLEVDLVARYLERLVSGRDPT